MALNSSTSFPPVGPGPYSINRDWCIGDSLNYINQNSSIFDARTLELSTLFLAVSSFSTNLSAKDSSTIDLDFKSVLNILSADIVNNSINAIKLGGDITQSGKALLTAASFSGLSPNQALVWDGTNWANQTIVLGGGGTLPTTDTDFGDIFYDYNPSTNTAQWLLKGSDINPSYATFEPVTTAKIRANAVTPSKLSLGAPSWQQVGGINFVGINNTSPNSNLTIGSNIISTGTSKLLTVNSGTFTNTAVGTVSALASFGVETAVDNYASLGVKVRRNASTPNNYTSTAFGLTLDYGTGTANIAQLWLAGTGNIGIGTSVPNHSLTVIGTLSSTGIIFGTSTQTTNLSGGSIGQIPYQTGSSSTGFLATGSSGQILQSNGASAPSWINQSSITAGAVTNGVYTNGSYSDPSWITSLAGTKITGAVATANNALNTNRAISATRLEAGTAMSIVYQNAVNNTAFLAAGTSGQLLQTNGTGAAPTWISPSSLTVGNATNATNATNSTIAASCTGNAATVTNGVYTVGDQTIAGTKTFSNTIFAPAIYMNATGSETRLRWQLTGKEVYLYGRDSDDGLGLFDTGTNIGRWFSDVSGNFWVYADITAFASDIRLKENIVPITDALGKVKSIDGFTYNFNSIGEQHGFDKEKRHAGVSAQQIQKILPEAVEPAPFDKDVLNNSKKSKTGEDYLTVKYEKLVPLLIEAIKELSKRVEELENK